MQFVRIALCGLAAVMVGTAALAVVCIVYAVWISLKSGSTGGDISFIGGQIGISFGKVQIATTPAAVLAMLVAFAVLAFVGFERGTRRPAEGETL